MAKDLPADIDQSMPAPAAATGDRRLGPFHGAAAELRARGLAVVPCGGEDGKVPLIRWGKWTGPPVPIFVEKMIQRFSWANIGIVTGRPSGITLVDCDDDEAVVPLMIRRCGDTPLKTKTPSGGVHLWYRHAGETCANLRAEGLNVDVRGTGGIAIVPPSIRPDGPYAGRAYEFLEGSWDDLFRLPVPRSGSLPMIDGASQAVPLRAVKKGRRNKVLFNSLLREVKHCDDRDALRDVAERINGESFEDPLEPAEVEKTTRSAWGYEERGKNWVGKEARILLPRSQHEALRTHRHGVDAWFLLATLRFAHWDRDEFAGAAKAMADADVIPGWGHQRYRNALAALVEVGILTVTHEGGSHIGDPRRFAFGPCLIKGTETGHNITEHLPLSLGEPPARSQAQRSRPVSPARAISPPSQAGGSGSTISPSPSGGSVQLGPVARLGELPAEHRPDNLTLFAAAVRDARIARNLTQAQAAALAGISRSALGNIENGIYAAKTWDAERRVIARVEASDRGSDSRFIVTNLAGTPCGLYERFYCARGQAENLIKAHKLHLASDRTSCTKATANQFRLVLHTAAYWLLLTLRGLAPKRSFWRAAQFDTLRLMLVKVAARVTELATRIRLARPSSYPYRNSFTLLAARAARPP